MALNEQATTSDLTELAAEIVSAYVSNNSVRPSELPSLIADIHRAPSPPYGGTLSAFLSTVPLPKGGAGRWPRFSRAHLLYQ